MENVNYSGSFFLKCEVQEHNEMILNKRNILFSCINGDKWNCIDKKYFRVILVILLCFVYLFLF